MQKYIFLAFKPSRNIIIDYERQNENYIYEDIGVKIFSKSLFTKIHCNNPLSLEDDLYKKFIYDENLYALNINETILDIGTFDEIQKTKDILKNNEILK